MSGITVVVPTIGRESLDSCLSSFAGQLSKNDAVVVVSDGHLDWVRGIVESYRQLYPRPAWTYKGIDKQECWGHPAANEALDNYVKTSHVWRIDDDDEATPGTIATLRAHLDDPWTIFRMTFGEGHHANGLTCWRMQELREGDIGTPMVFARLGAARFGRRYEGDWDYAQALHTEHGDPVWDETVVALIRPVADVSLAQ